MSDPQPPAPDVDAARSEPATSPEPLAPARVDTVRIIAAGLVAWAVALVITLLVPSLHTGERAWWPWTCVAGLALGLVGLAYVGRGRGNANGARTGQ